MTEESKNEITTKPSPAKSEKGFGISVKSICLALLVVVVTNSVAGFNSDELKQTPLIGNFMPVGLYFCLFFFAVFWNGFWAKISPKMTLSKKELAAYFILTLVGSWCATSGFYRYFNRQLISPIFNESSQTSWKKHDIIDMMPKKLFPLEGKLDAIAQETPKEGVIPVSGDTVYNGFAQGLFIQSETILGGLYEMSDIIRAWVPPLKYWGAFMILFMMMIIMLSIMLHRQWSKYEQLSYPLANIANALIDREDGKTFGKVFYSKLFWSGFIFVVSIHSINCGHSWFPSEIPSISLNWTMGWISVFPSIAESNSIWGMNGGKIYFSLLAVCYFCSQEVSLTLGISNIILSIIGVQFYFASGQIFNSNDVSLTRAGAYMAYGIMLAWAGRNYYLRLSGRALGFGLKNEETQDGVWAARFFMLFFFAVIYTLTTMGMDWVIAVIFTCSHLLMFSVMARIVCEAGLPFMQAGLNLSVLISKIGGMSLIGAKGMVLFTWFSTILAQDPREAMMPFVSNGLKISETFKLKIRRLVIAMSCFLVLGLVVGFIATSYTSYKFGSQKDVYAWEIVGVKELNKSVAVVAYLDDTQQREQSDAASGLGRLTLVDPDTGSLKFFMAGMVAVALLFFLKFRFPGFWIHPLLLVVWGTYPIQAAWVSYLVGWAIKSLVVKFGGGKVYQELKPIFIGLIVGELFIGGMAVLIGFIYYGLTGLAPAGFTFLPG